MNLFRETAYIQYAANKARTENAMKKLNESGNVLTEEQINKILMEEFNFQEIINKIKSVFSTMTDKFVEFTKKQIQNKHDAAYLNAIKDKVVQVAKGKNISMEMRDYWVGTDNIKNASVIFDKFKNIPYQNVDNKDACIANIQKTLFPDFNPQNIKFDQYCMNYFQGGAAVKSTNVNAMPFDKIITWCIDFPRILDAAKADADKNSALISQAIQTITAKVQQPANAAVQQPPVTQGQGQGQTTTAAQGQTAQNDSTDYSKADIHHMAYKFKNILEAAFNEADNATPPTGQEAKPVAPAEKPATPADNKTDEQKTGSTMKINQKDVEASKAQDTGLNIFVSSMQSVAISIANARLRSINIIYTDYIKLLQTVCPRNEYMNVEQPKEQPAVQGQGQG